MIIEMAREMRVDKILFSFLKKKKENSPPGSKEGQISHRTGGADSCR